jgi:hypothetical protein
MRGRRGGASSPGHRNGAPPLCARPFCAPPFCTRIGLPLAATASLLLAATACTSADLVPSDVRSSAVATGSLADPSTNLADAGETGAQAPATTVQEAVATLVTARAAAVTGRNRAAWLATLADPGSSFGADQAGLFDRLVSLPVSGLTATAVTVAPATPATGAATSAPTQTAVAQDWVADLRLVYRFDGYDRGDRTFRVSYALARTSGGWRLAGVGPGPTDAQPFDLVGARSLRSASTLVIGDVPDGTLQTYLELGDAARPRIEQAWGSARPGVLVAPRTTDELQAQLGRGSIAGLDQVAAVTDGPLTTGTPAASDRVYLNPGAFAKLSPAGRGVVITHELTHVTVRGTTTRSVPIWLSEGFADDVAFAASGLPVKTVAADLFVQVRAGQVPTALPGVQDFDPARGAISPVYNEAWLAVMLLRQTYGATTLSSFYRAVAGGPTGDPSVTGTADERTRMAFVDVVGVTQDAFVTAWRADLVRLAA